MEQNYTATCLFLAKHTNEELNDWYNKYKTTEIPKILEDSLQNYNGEDTSFYLLSSIMNHPRYAEFSGEYALIIADIDGNKNALDSYVLLTEKATVGQKASELADVLGTNVKNMVDKVKEKAYDSGTKEIKIKNPFETKMFKNLKTKVSDVTSTIKQEITEQKEHKKDFLAQKDTSTNDNPFMSEIDDLMAKPQSNQHKKIKAEIERKSKEVNEAMAEFYANPVTFSTPQQQQEFNAFLLQDKKEFAEEELKDLSQKQTEGALTLTENFRLSKLLIDKQIAENTVNLGIKYPSHKVQANPIYTQTVDTSDEANKERLDYLYEIYKEVMSLKHKQVFEVTLEDGKPRLVSEPLSLSVAETVGNFVKINLTNITSGVVIRTILVELPEDEPMNEIIALGKAYNIAIPNLPKLDIDNVPPIQELGNQMLVEYQKPNSPTSTIDIVDISDVEKTKAIKENFIKVLSDFDYVTSVIHSKYI